MVQTEGNKEDKIICVYIQNICKQAYRGFSFIWYDRQQEVYTFYLQDTGKLFKKEGILLLF